MKKFQFRLDRVLNYREQVEKEKQIALTKVHQLVVDHEKKLLQAYTVLEEARENLRQAGTCGELDVAELREHRLHIGSVRRRLSEVLKRLRKLEVDLEHRRGEAVKARKERRVLEMVKGRRHAEYVAEAERAEQAELDEIATKKEVIRRNSA